MPLFPILSTTHNNPPANCCKTKHPHTAQADTSVSTTNKTYSSSYAPPSVISHLVDRSVVERVSEGKISVQLPVECGIPVTLWHCRRLDGLEAILAKINANHRAVRQVELVLHNHLWLTRRNVGCAGALRRYCSYQLKSADRGGRGWWIRLLHCSAGPQQAGPIGNRNTVPDQTPHTELCRAVEDNSSIR